MKTTISVLTIVAGMAGAALRGAEDGDVMSAAYRKHWNPSVQDRIDRAIDRHRKADAVLRLKGVPAGTAVEIEQRSHDFIFGANIFNFNQLGTDARNLYRLWFSIEPMMGTTWWNVVDGCGAPGEPTISGLFTRDMRPKPSCHALNKLINDEWKTRTTVRVGADGAARFRGFRGTYRATFTDGTGAEREVTFHLAKDGDGIE